MFTESHTTTPADNGTHHYWEVRGPHGAVSLSLLHSRAPGFASLAADGGYIARNLSATESGHWVFDVVQSHTFGSTGWALCLVHEACDVDAFAHDIADPIWQGLRVSGVTDRAVYAELRALADVVFAEAAA